MRYVLAIAVALAAVVVPVLAQEEPAELPVTRIVLFRSGVGYFEHSGQVEGNARARLGFKEAQINDVLKSMILMDLDGGSIGAVTYPAKEPLQRALESFGIDLSGNPGLAEILRQVRGAVVTVQAPDKLTGKVLGVETRQKRIIEGGATTIVTETVLNIVTPTGVKAIPTDSIHLIQLQDEDLQAELNKALDLLIDSRDMDHKPVDVAFNGEGERRVRLGYIVEAPVWKTSYRLDLSGEDAQLQGWAIVENTTDADWQNVELSLVSGRPVSFVMDLYTPLFAPRPVVEPELYANLMPRKYAEGFAEREKEAMEFDDERKSEAQGLRRGRAADRAAYAPEMARAATNAARDLSLAAGVAAAAATQEAGELFRFDIEKPVTLARRGSAMLPIVAQAVKAEKVSIYNQSVDSKHPMNGAYITNNTGVKLPGGPITVFDDATYAGDAQVDTLVPGDERLISYALDLNVSVDPSQRSTSDIVSGRIVDGVLHLRREHRYSHTYKLKNKAGEERQVIVEHPFNAGRELVQPEKFAEKTESLYRFRVPVEEDATEDFVVEERQVVGETVALIGQSPDRLVYYVRQGKLSQQVRDAIDKLAGMKREQASLEADLNQAQSRLKAIVDGQERLRRNLQTVGQGSELGRRYLAKLGEEEDEIEKLQTQIADLEDKVSAKQEEIANYLKDLDLD